MNRIIRSALISVFDKTGLEPVLFELHRLGVTLYSTGGTRDFIARLGLPVVAVESVTGFPEILGGRVKTLHPHIFGGILARRDVPEDLATLHQHGIPEMDLILVDLYPFEETLKSDASTQDIIEKIDIGGISLIRAAAKNYNDTLVVASKTLYDKLLQVLVEGKASTDLETRQWFAAYAFHITSHYDTQIFNWFNRQAAIPVFKESLKNGRTLRYGENPHQQAVFFSDEPMPFEQLWGKELSFNNLVDLDAALNLVGEFEAPTFVVIKHTNACGVASRETIEQAWTDALAGDPVSAFGGVLACNRPVSAALAEELNKLFFEILIAPGFSEESLPVLKQKKNRILLKLTGEIPVQMQRKAILNGLITQDADTRNEQPQDLNPVTALAPDSEQLKDLSFASILVKHLKSNAIVLVKNRQLLGMGCGQTSRVNALEQAILKAKKFGFDLQGAVMASDAFFPFPDCVEIAHKAGITAVVQPGGSIKDQESIDYCNSANMAMVVTGIRHFRH